MISTVQTRFLLSAITLLSHTTANYQPSSKRTRKRTYSRAAPSPQQVVNASTFDTCGKTLQLSWETPVVPAGQVNANSACVDNVRLSLSGYVSLFGCFTHRVTEDDLVDGNLEYELDSLVDYNIVHSRRRNVPPVVECRVRWKGSCEDSWHEPPDFVNARRMCL